MRGQQIDNHEARALIHNTCTIWQLSGTTLVICEYDYFVLSYTFYGEKELIVLSLNIHYQCARVRGDVVEKETMQQASTF